MDMQGQARWLPEHILTAAAICMMHPTTVPHQLLVHAMSGLLAILTAAGPSSGSAAAMLSEALSSPLLVHWQPVLGNTSLVATK